MYICIIELSPIPDDISSEIETFVVEFSSFFLSSYILYKVYCLMYIIYLLIENYVSFCVYVASALYSVYTILYCIIIVYTIILLNVEC